MLRPARLSSSRLGTTYDFHTLLMRLGRKRAFQLDDAPPGGAPLLYDDGLITRVHEAIHWRQHAGTTVGAFLSWLRHARAVDAFSKLRNLDGGRRAALLALRRKRPLLAFDAAGRPDPPIVLAAPADPVELLRCTFAENLVVSKLFRNPSPIKLPHAPLQEIFASVVADAATAMTDRHPSWDGLSYEAVQAAYTLPDNFARLQVQDPFASGAQKPLVEMTTDDIFEAGAVANELLLECLVDEHQIFGPADTMTSICRFRKEIDTVRLRANSAWFLRSGHGVALREFFVQSRLDSELAFAWTTAAAVADFALNPPLPPVVLPSRRPLTWRCLYPPLRFTLAARAAKRLSPLPAHPTGPEVAAYQAALADATGLDFTPGPSLNRRPPDAPDFARIKAHRLEGSLYAEFTYYDFLLWCQNEIARRRADDPRLAVLPGILVWELRRTDPHALDELLGDLALVPPLETDDRGDLLHPPGSSAQLGSWIATSILACGAADDLVTGQGAQDEMEMPEALIASDDARNLVRAFLTKVCAVDPYG